VLQLPIHSPSFGARLFNALPSGREPGSGLEE
jgi:hypothetical protein